VEKLFIYGTLLDPNVQLDLLGRICQGKWGLIDNYILLRDWNVEGTAYPRLFPHSAGCVVGQVIEVSDEELLILDEYETDAYVREKILVKDLGYAQSYFYNRNLDR